MIDSFVHIFKKGNGKTTFCLLHGTGGDENDLVPIARSIDPHAGVIGIRGNVSENGMNRFFRRHAEGVFDQEDIILQSGNMMAFLQKAAAHYEFTLQHTTFLGYSNGANIATSVLFLHPQIVQSAILLRPMLTLVPDIAPDLSGHKIFIAAGLHDGLVPVEHTNKLADLYRTYGAVVELAWLNAAHGLTREDIEKAKIWYKKI